MSLPNLLASEVLSVQMFKAALSYLCSFSQSLAYSLGPCEQKMLIDHSLLPPPLNHLPPGSQSEEINQKVF